MNLLSISELWAAGNHLCEEFKGAIGYLEREDARSHSKWCARAAIEPELTSTGHATHVQAEFFGGLLLSAASYTSPSELATVYTSWSAVNTAGTGQATSFDATTLHVDTVFTAMQLENGKEVRGLRSSSALARSAALLARAAAPLAPTAVAMLGPRETAVGL